MKFLGWILLLLVVVSIGGYFFKDDLFPMLPDPPVSITFRKSRWWDGYVAQIKNNHSTTIQVTLYATNRHSSKTYEFYVPAGKTKEIGMREAGLNFVPGYHGYIKVQGYTKKLRYKLKSGGTWKRWFSL